MKLITCPTPKQVESENILNIQQDAQQYFDESIRPHLIQAIESSGPIAIARDLKISSSDG